MLVFLLDIALKITVSAIAMLRDKPPGSFVVRNSNTFQGAFGLALKVAQVPPNVQIKEGGLLFRKLFFFSLLQQSCII